MTEIIGEAGISHNGDLTTALTLVRMIAQTGCKVFKTQLYDPSTLFPDGQVWSQGKNWYPEVLKTKLSKQNVERIAAECADQGIEFMASVFDLERLQWCEGIKVKRYKVASRSIHDTSLISSLCATGKPLIVSLGHWSKPELPKIPTKAPVTFLYCVPEYPADPAKVDFDAVARLKGYSDHCTGIEAAKKAIEAGATVVEKHVTLTRHDTRGPDHVCSCEPWELRELVGYAKEKK